MFHMHSKIIHIHMYIQLYTYTYIIFEIISIIGYYKMLTSSLCYKLSLLLTNTGLAKRFVWETLNESFQFYSVQLLSHVRLFMILWTAARQASLSVTNSWSLLRLASIELVMPTISSSVIPFSSCLQSFPASGSFIMSPFFASGDQSVGASTLASVLPMNIQDWFLLGLIGLTS